MQMQMPVVALVVVGSLLLTDLERAPAHAVAALVIKVVAEQDLLPEGEIFGIIAGLLGFLLVESCARVFTLVRFYRRDEAMVDTAA